MYEMKLFFPGFHFLANLIFACLTAQHMTAHNYDQNQNEQYTLKTV